MFHLSIIPFPIGYLGPFALFPALLTEIVAFYLLQRRNFAPFALVSVVLLLANLPALFLGYVFLAIMHHPEGQVRFSIVSFLVSWALSAAIEYAVCRKVKLMKELPHLLVTLLISSAASYAVLAVMVWRLGRLAVN
jgi:hypothetical protein